MSGICAGRVAIVTGAGRGLGRAHALELARQGAAVIVNDHGGARDGRGSDAAPAAAVAAEIRAAGGRAAADTEDVADWQAAERLVSRAVAEFGGLDVLVSNAGILRDQTIAAMTEENWDAVVRVHLRGTAAPARFAAAYWRARAKETGDPTGARLITTTSASGIYGNFGQSNYGAAKAGIAAFTVIAAKELARYGATANAVSPSARTRLTEDLLPEERAAGLDPEEVAPLVAWLASDGSAAVNGRVFAAGGGRIGVAEGWRLGPVAPERRRFSAGELGSVIPGLVERAAPGSGMSGTPDGTTA